MMKGGVAYGRISFHALIGLYYFDTDFIFFIKIPQHLNIYC